MRNLNLAIFAILAVSFLLVSGCLQDGDSTGAGVRTAQPATPGGDSDDKYARVPVYPYENGGGVTPSATLKVVVTNPIDGSLEGANVGVVRIGGGYSETRQTNANGEATFFPIRTAGTYIVNNVTLQGYTFPLDQNRQTDITQSDIDNYRTVTLNVFMEKLFPDAVIPLTAMEVSSVTGLVEFTVFVGNEGDAAYSDPAVLVQVNGNHPDGTPFYYEFDPVEMYITVNPQETEFFDTFPIYLDPGSYTFTATVDPFNDIIELDENNNTNSDIAILSDTYLVPLDEGETLGNLHGDGLLTCQKVSIRLDDVNSSTYSATFTLLDASEIEVDVVTVGVGEDLRYYFNDGGGSEGLLDSVVVEDIVIAPQNYVDLNVNHDHNYTCG